MRVLSSIAAAAIVGGSFFSGAPAHAKPFIYTNVYSYGGDFKTCLKRAKQALVENGFSDFEENISAESKSGVTSGYRSQDSYLTAEIGCDQKLGVTTLGVAGLDNDATYEMYQKLGDATW